MNASSEQRLQDLESRFMELDGKLKDSPEKEAISVLHAMFQETLRNVTPGTDNSQHHSNGKSLEEIVNLYKHAPDMKGDAENGGLEVGIRAPDFSLPDASKRTVRLSDYRGKNVILCFYPLDWSPACSDQLSLYQSELDEMRKYDAQVIAVSVDSIYSHGAWAAVRGITFPLLSDFHPKGEVARRYNVWRETDGFTERAVYVIERDGVIRYCTISPELHHIPSIYELFDQLQSLQKQAERS